MSYGYKKDLSALKKFRELLITREELLTEKRDQEAIERKLTGLEYGRYGYEKDLEAARRFNESLVAKGDPEAVKRKIEGLSLSLGCRFERLAISCSRVYRRPINDYKSYGSWYWEIRKSPCIEVRKSRIRGYKHPGNREEVIEFIKKNHVPF